MQVMMMTMYLIGSCYGAGYEDVRNVPLNGGTYLDNCYEKYYDGFIDVCMSVQGNTRDVCEYATDA